MSNQNALYEITTRMEKEDYRKFSYLIAFRNKVRTILLIILLAAIGAGLWVFMDEIFSVPKFLGVWVILIITAFAAIFLRVEYKAYNRSNQIRAGLAGNRQTITFFENYLIAQADDVKTNNKIKYENLYQALETEAYYIIYASASNASMIRKKDIDEEERTDFNKFLKIKFGTRYVNMIKGQ